MRVAYDVTSLLDARTGVGAFAGEVADVASRRRRTSTSSATRCHGEDGARHRAHLLPAAVRGAGTDGGAPAAPAVAADRPAPDRVVDRRRSTSSTDRTSSCRRHGRGRSWSPCTTSRASAPELCTPRHAAVPDLIRRALRRGAHVHAVSQFVADEVVDVFGVDAGPRARRARTASIRPHEGDAGGGPGARAATGTSSPSARSSRARTCRCSSTRSTSSPQTTPTSRSSSPDQDGWGAGGFTAAVAARPPPRPHRPPRLGRRPTPRADLLAGAQVFAYPVEVRGLRPPAARSHGRRDARGHDPRRRAPRSARRRRAPRRRPATSTRWPTALARLLDDAGRARALDRGRARARRPYSWDASRGRACEPLSAPLLRLPRCAP